MYSSPASHLDGPLMMHGSTGARQCSTRLLRAALCDMCPLLHTRKDVTLNNTAEWEAKGGHDAGVESSLGAEEGRGRRRNRRRKRRMRGSMRVEGSLDSEEGKGKA